MRSNQVSSVRTSDYTTVETAIKLFFEDTAGWVETKKIASRIQRNYNTTRFILNKLTKPGKKNEKPVLLKQRAGREVVYRVNRSYPDELIRMQQLPNVKFTEIHGLCLYIDELFNNQKGILGIDCFLCDGSVTSQFICNSCGHHFRTGSFKYHAQFGTARDMSFSFGVGKGSLTIWLNCSDSPLRFRDFQHFLTFIHAKTGVRVWENLKFWRVKQFGLNIDGIKIEIDEKPYRNNKPIMEFFRLSNWGSWFAQKYKKKLWDGLKEVEINRNEFHFQKDWPIDSLIAAIQGSLTLPQAMSGITYMKNDFQSLAREMRSIGSMMLKQDREHKKEMSKLRKELAELQRRGKL